MKAEFEVPEITVVSFAVEDVITTSGGGSGRIEDELPFVPAV